MNRLLSSSPPELAPPLPPDFPIELATSDTSGLDKQMKKVEKKVNVIEASLQKGLRETNNEVRGEKKILKVN